MYPCLSQVIEEQFGIHPTIICFLRSSFQLAPLYWINIGTGPLPFVSRRSHVISPPPFFFHFSRGLQTSNTYFLHPPTTPCVMFHLSFVSLCYFRWLVMSTPLLYMEYYLAPLCLSVLSHNTKYNLGQCPLQPYSGSLFC